MTSAGPFTLLRLEQESSDRDPDRLGVVSVSHASLLDRVSDRSGSTQTAFRAGPSSLSYQGLVDLVRRVAGGLEQRQIDQSTCLVIALSDVRQAAAAALGGWWHGMRVCAIRSQSNSERIRRLKALADPAVVVADQAGLTVPSLTFDELLGRPTRRRPNPDATACSETLTSGTTGQPRCITRSLSALSASVDAVASVAQINSADRLTAFGPALATTTVLPALANGAAVLSLDGQTPSALWHELDTAQPTVLSATPYLFEVLAASTSRVRPLSSIRLAINATARLRPSTAATLVRLANLKPLNVYCSAEAGNIAMNRPADTVEQILETVGSPLPTVDVRIAPLTASGSPDTRPDQPGRGQVHVHSPFAADRYRGNEAATRRTFVGGWVVHNDIGEIDATGRVRLLGRLDHRIHVDGERIDPQEVEDQLMDHPLVDDALVTAEPHPRLGQVPVAYLVASSDAIVSELRTHLAQRLDPLHIPRRFHFVTEIPRDFMGQPVRRSIEPHSAIGSSEGVVR